MGSAFSAIHMRSVPLLSGVNFPMVLSRVVSSALCQVKIVSSPSVASTIGSRPPWIYWLPLLVAQFSIIYEVVPSAASPPPGCLPLLRFVLDFAHVGVSAHWLTSASLSWRRSKSLLNVELLLKLLLLFCLDCHFHVVVVASLRLGGPASSRTSSALRFHVFGFFSDFFGLVWLRLGLRRFLNWFVLAWFLGGFGGLVADVCGVEGFFGKNAVERSDIASDLLGLEAFDGGLISVYNLEGLDPVDLV